MKIPSLALATMAFAFAAFASPLRAQITFTFAGVDADAAPFTASFTTVAHFAPTGQPLINDNTDNDDNITSTQYAWGQSPDSGVTQELFASTSGSFFTGGSVVPDAGRLAVVGFQEDAITHEQQFILAILDQSDAGFGSVAGTETPIPLRYALAIFPGPFAFATPAEDTDAIAYFSNYTGTFDLSAAPGMMGFSDLPSGSDAFEAVFQVTSLTIGGSAVPEPSTSAALAGVAVLGLALLRRRALAR